MSHAATVLNSLRVPPGNQLKALKGDRSGQHSIRINDQWRVCFVWRMVTRQNRDKIAHRIRVFQPDGA